MQTAKVIQFSDYIPRKPADREPTGSGRHHYQCADCGSIDRFRYRLSNALYCSCGAEMRPVAPKAEVR